MRHAQEHRKSDTVTDKSGFGLQFRSHFGFAFVCRLFLQQKRKKYSNLNQTNFLRPLQNVGKKIKDLFRLYQGI